MSANLSFPNDSHASPHFFPISYHDCYITSPTNFILITFNIIQVIVISPLCISILYLGLQPIQQNLSTPLTVTMSHSDSFTYNMVIMELISTLGCIVSLIGNCTENLEILDSGLYIFWCTWYGQISFHSLTCLERYLAVVHPITYLSLRNKKGIRIRNMSICFVWLLCFGGLGALITGNYVYLDTCLLIITTTATSFFSISVLCVLVRPGPGEQGKDRRDQSKHRAFYIIVVIMGILMLRLTVDLVWTFMDLSEHNSQCMMMVGNVWISLPSSLVLPLLYLQRAGKLMCCKDTIIRRLRRHNL